MLTIQPIVLSHVQVEPLIKARQKGQTSIELSPDLGLTTVTVMLTPEGVLFPNGEHLEWQSIEKISKTEVNCYVLEDDIIRPIQVFSEYTNRVCSLMPTKGAQEIARLNPWSQALFYTPKIRQIMGDAYEVVQTFEDGSFSRIIHDPPTFSLAGELYSGAFYQQLFRVLKRGGRLFHYIGDPNSKASGGATKGALKRLQEAGFARVVRKPEVRGCSI